mgnify:CR=1 FL=1
MAILYGGAIWLLAGLAREQWWIQFGCFLLSAYLMVQLSNLNVLIRIYSRMISVSFIFLSAAAVFLFPSIPGAVVQVCFITALMIFYNCYQDQESPGWTFYTFLCLGAGSLAYIHLLYFVPIFWLMMATIVYSFCWRNFFASLIGLLTPYWFWMGWTLWQENGALNAITRHFLALAEFQSPDYASIPSQHILILGLVTILGLTGMIHYLRTSSRDKIRTRQLYYSFFVIGTSAFLFLVLQPQHEDMLLRIMMIITSPLIGHFLALTKTKITNVAFITITVAVLLITAVNLWMSSSLF